MVRTGSVHLLATPKARANIVKSNAFLPTNREQMRARGYSQLDVLLITGDAYLDHPAFGPILIARWLEHLGYRVGIVAQPRWQHPDDLDDFTCMGQPRLFVGVSAGNLDSMLNKLTAQKKVRARDDYSPGGEPGQRPNRATVVYANLCRRLFPRVPIVIGGIEASLRRIAHYDYWQDQVRRSILFDSKSHLLVYGMGERAIEQVAKGLASGHSIDELTGISGTAHVIKLPENVRNELVARFTAASKPGGGIHDGCGTVPVQLFASDDPLMERVFKHLAPYRSVVVLPSFEQVSCDKQAFVQMTRLVQQQLNPFNALPMLQIHGDQAVLLWPPQPPLTCEQLDCLYQLPFERAAHPQYKTTVPALASVERSITALRGCFGGCSFCSISEHQGRFIQSRSAASVISEATKLARADKFDGTIADVGGPSANMYRMGCTDPKLAKMCRKYSCVHPKVCRHLQTDHAPFIELLKRVRRCRGVKHVFVNSGIRYDLANKSDEFIRELAFHHTSGQLSVAPEHCQPNVLYGMRKPPIACYERFAQRFLAYSKDAKKRQFLAPYLIVGHPGESIDDTIALALYLKQNNLRVTQVQEFIPTPMTVATCMYYTGIDPNSGKAVFVERDLRRKRAMKALLMWWDPKQWPLAKEALGQAGRSDLIGKLIPRGMNQRDRFSTPRRQARS